MERTPSREAASNGPSVRGSADRLKPGGLRALAAVAGRKSAPFHGADGASFTRASPESGLVLKSPGTFPIFRTYQSNRVCDLREHYHLAAVGAEGGLLSRAPDQ
jgi:hypothetical protein